MTKKKLAKILLSATLVLSILGSNFSYVGAGNVQEDTAEEITSEENVVPEENIPQEETATPDTPLPEGGTEESPSDGEVQVPDSEPGTEENGEVAEGESVEKTEEEEVTEEAVATLSDEGEEEIPEITDKELLLGVDERASSDSPCVGGDCNKDQVCRGGGKTGDASPDYPNSDDKRNHHPNNMPYQDPQKTNPNSHQGYWDDTKNGIQYSMPV